MPLTIKLPDQPARAELTLPHNLAFGFAAHPAPGLTLSADLHLALWSDSRVFEVQFPSPAVLPTTTSPRFRDAASVRLGAEYLVVRRANRFAFRAGIAYDETPVRADGLSPLTPGLDRLILAGGLGWSRRGFGVALGYAGSLMRDRVATATEFPARYGGQIHVLSAAATYQWGQ